MTVHEVAQNLHKVRKPKSKPLRRKSDGPNYLNAVIEYLAAEILQASGEESYNLNVSRMLPRVMQLAMRSDEELSKLLSGVTVAKSAEKFSVLARLVHEGFINAVPDESTS